MSSLVAKNYSNALFELALESDSLAPIKDELAIINSTINDNTDLFKTLNHPNVEKDDKKEIFSKIFSDCHRLIKNFIYLLIDKDRLSLLNEIKEAYDGQYRMHEGIELAIVTSAQKLSDSDLKAIQEMLEKRFKTTVELQTKIDESLIAGVRVEINNEVIDNTILNRMRNLQDEIDKQSL